MNPSRTYEENMAALKKVLTQRTYTALSHRNIEFVLKYQNATTQELAAYLRRQQAELRKRLATLDLIDKYGQRNHEDTYGGYIKSQYDIGQLGQDQAHAWSAVMRNPTAANLEYAQHVDSMIEDYTQRNQQALDPTGNHLVSMGWWTIDRPD